MNAKDFTASLTSLVEQRIAAKRDEDAAAELRKGVDAQIADLMRD